MKNLLICTLTLCSFGLAVAAYAAPEAPAGKLTLEYTKNKSVIFEHSEHKDVPCVTCHHLVDGKEKFAKCASAGCHDAFDRKSEEAKTAKGYFRIIHEKSPLKNKTCLACHSEYVQDHPDKKKDMTGCKGSDCHP